ncbi:MAG: hypothetical protein ACRCVT_01675 [Leadbetterella sp.]
MKKILTISFLFSISVCTLYSQNKIVKGRVITEDLDTAPYTLIKINDSVEIGKTDLSGFFQIEIPVSQKKMEFGFVGFELANIEVTDNCTEVEVVMIYSSTYDFMTLKKVDRLRRKRYKKLPELHKKAFEKGIFKTDKACYKQQFIPFYKKK